MAYFFDHGTADTRWSILRWCWYFAKETVSQHEICVPEKNNKKKRRKIHCISFNLRTWLKEIQCIFLLFFYYFFFKLIFFTFILFLHTTQHSNNLRCNKFRCFRHFQNYVESSNYHPASSKHPLPSSPPTKKIISNPNQILPKRPLSGFTICDLPGKDCHVFWCMVWL